MPRYFTEQLLASNVNLENVFPEKQKNAQNRNGVSYNMADVALYLKDASENFKSKDPKFLDLDEAIKEIMNRYYKSIGEPNPFEVKEKDKFEGKTPKEAAVVTDGEVKRKGALKAAPVEKAAPAPALSESDLKKLDDLRKQLESNKEIFIEFYDENERKEFIELLVGKLEATEVLAEDSEYYAERAKIYQQFIKELEKI